MIDRYLRQEKSANQYISSLQWSVFLGLMVWMLELILGRIGGDYYCQKGMGGFDGLRQEEANLGLAEVFAFENFWKL